MAFPGQLHNVYRFLVKYIPLLEKRVHLRRRECRGSIILSPLPVRERERVGVKRIACPRHCDPPAKVVGEAIPLFNEFIYTYGTK